MSALIQRDDHQLSVTWTPEAIRLKTEALEAAAVVAVVTNPVQQAAAVEAQRALKAMANDCEKARKACKEPVLEFGRRIDSSAAAFRKELDAELMRLGKAVGDFVTAQEAKRRAEEALRLKELAEIERKRLAELAKAETHDQIDAVQEKFNEAARNVPVIAPPPRATGQVVRDDWEITVTDIWLLARAHPGCVRIEELKSEIKALLNAGVDVKGVSAKRVTTSGVRVGRTPAALEMNAT